MKLSKISCQQHVVGRFLLHIRLGASWPMPSATAEGDDDKSWWMMMAITAEGNQALP